MFSINKLEIISQLCENGIVSLDSISHYNSDTMFNNIIDKLCAELTGIDDTKLKDLSEKLIVYKHAYKLNLHRDRSNGNLAYIIRSHVIDLWKIILFNIDYIVQHIIISQLKDENTELKQNKVILGKYIESLQYSFIKRNREITYQRNQVKKLNQLIINHPVHNYELIQQESNNNPIINVISSWF